MVIAPTLRSSPFADGDGSARHPSRMLCNVPDGRPAHGHQVRAVIENERTIGHVWYGPESDASDDRWWLWDI
jgi:hypothetical protein